MVEVAGRVVSNAVIDFGAATDSALSQKLCYVADARSEAFRAFGVLRVVFQQFAVFFQQRAAPGGVDDDRGRPVRRQKPLEGVNVAPRQSARRFELTGVSVKRAAT